MKFSDFTKEQQLAITASGQNIIVSAGAGSGKTAVLTQRVLYFIKEKGYKLDEFLILTFTKLASGEMRERIRKALMEEGLEDANEVDVASITTFDAYALSLVQKYHFLLNVSPNIRMIDANVISVRKRTILEDIFEEYYQNANTIFIKMIEQYCFKDDLELRELVLKLSDQANLDMDTNHYLHMYMDTFYNREKIKGYIAYFTETLRKKITVLKETILSLPTTIVNQKSKQSYKEAVETYVEMLFSATSYDEILRSFPSTSYPRKPSEVTEQEEEDIQNYKAAYLELKEFASQLPNTEEEFYKQFEDEKPFVQLLIEIVEQLHMRIENYKKEYDVYEFQDIAKMALRIVDEHPEIRDEIKNKLKMIMIDEYQDTSILQEEFIAKIANQNVYMVGDIKQSIYRFRNAKSEIFAKKYQKYVNHEGGLAINLNKNFRSRKEVLQDINFIFKQIMTLDFGNADYQNNHLIEYGNKGYLEAGSLNETRHATFLTYPPQVNSYQIPFVEAKLIAQDIIDKMNHNYKVYTYDKQSKRPVLRDCQFSDFCILMDRGSDFDIYVKVFNAYHIPLFVENDENISSNEVVLILTNLLRLIKMIQVEEYHSNAFKKAFVSVARSFLYQYSDQKLLQITSENRFYEDEICCKLRENIYANQDLSIAKLFSKLILNLEIYEKCARIGNLDKNEKYLDTFMQMFDEMSKLDYSIDDFISYMEHINTYNLKITLASTGSTMDSVRMMNIHKSKGLEFSIVYFSGLKKTFNQQDLKEKFAVSTNYGLILPPTDEKKMCIAQYLHKREEKENDISEKIRLFYVALTRTKEKMLFILENPTYYTEKYNRDLQKANEYIEKTIQLHKTSINDEIIKMAICDYQNGKMNTQTLECIALLTHSSFPIRLLHFSKLKKENWTMDRIEVEMHRFKEQVTKPTFSTIETVFEAYLQDKIRKEEVVDTAQMLGYNLNGRFYEWIQFPKSKLDIKTYLSTCQIVNQEKLQECIEQKNKDQQIAYLNQIWNRLMQDPSVNVEEVWNMFDFLGIVLTDYSKMIIQKLINQTMTKEEWEAYQLQSEENKYQYTERFFQICKYDDGELFSYPIYQFYLEYKEGRISLEELARKLDVLGLELNIDFKTQLLVEKKSYTRETITDLFVDKGRMIKERECSQSFYDFLFPFYSHREFEKIVGELELEQHLQYKNQAVIPHLLVVEELGLEITEVRHIKASKAMALGVNKQDIAFGTKLHFIMELIDFKNPDYTIIQEPLYQNIVKKFLASPLLQHIEDGNIYKEYEFFDEEAQTSGMIDLMIMYDESIDIIDYKTKAIDDASYHKQLKQYQRYIQKTFHKKTNMYLYALLTGEYQEVK